MKKYLLWLGALSLGFWLTACNTSSNVFVLLPEEDESVFKELLLPTIKNRGLQMIFIT